MRFRALGALIPAALAVIGAAGAQSLNESVIFSFTSFPHGTDPYSPLTMDSEGNLYGTASAGGQSDAGVVFKLSPSGVQTVLYNFTGGADGGTPYGGVIRLPSGTIYGTTLAGGGANLGVVFSLDASGRETVLHSFQGGSDGASPYAGVISDAAGNLYGTTFSGGSSNGGTVYKLTAVGEETILHSFTGKADGGNPYAGVISDAAGNLYGTTYGGGTLGWGVVYRISPTGQELVIHAFVRSDRATNPYAGVISDGEGNLYGVAALTGGVIYKLDAARNYSVLYAFVDGVAPQRPEGGLVRDAAGNLYGTAQYSTAGGPGAVYELSASGTFSVLYVLPGASGDEEPPLGPNPGLVLDSGGNLYGATANGGVGGMVYKLSPSGEETMLYNFSGAPGGTNPSSGLTRDSAGSLYGTTYLGGAANVGAVYKVNLAGQETPLYSFTGGADGAYPGSNVVLDADGNVYGTTTRGGSAPGDAGYGVVFKITSAGQETVLHTFTNGSDGGYPGGVVLDSAGNLYGVAGAGATGGAGMVFKLSPLGQETVLYVFTGGADGGSPVAVILDPEGNLYGTTYEGGTRGFGTVFELSPAGQETVLHSFTGGPDGALPETGLSRDKQGNLYGTTDAGGNGVAEGGEGLVFELDAAGNYRVLYAFTGGSSGQDPSSTVVRDADGNLYGTTYFGGLAACDLGCGLVYKISPSGQETVLYDFTGATDGAAPLGVVLDSAGNLYGVTDAGGKGGVPSISGSGAGVVYKLSPQ
jgi:uncharacterized repeat protein (TIGR03803 family)